MQTPTKNKSVINCRKKTRYSDEYAAAASAEHTSMMSQSVDIYTYHCPECRGWHITGKKNGDLPRRKVFYYD